MDTTKDRNGMDLTEAEDIKKRWQEYTEELFKTKVLMTWPQWCGHSPRARFLEYEVKWALQSITTNKTSRADGIPAELFKILNDDAINVPYSVWQQIWKA